MDSFWKGAFTMRKHRDFEHNSFFAHALAGGAILGWKVDEDAETEDGEDYIDLDLLFEEELDEIEEEARKLLEYWIPRLKTFLLVRSPIDNSVLENPQLFYDLGVVLNGKVYEYLIPALNGMPPTRAIIEETLALYMENVVAGGREIEDYT